MSRTIYLTIYLGGAIDGVSFKDAINNRRKIAAHLERCGLIVVDPSDDLPEVKGLTANLQHIRLKAPHPLTPAEIVNKDLDTIDRCDALLVDLDDGPWFKRLWRFALTGRSHPARAGTYMEIRYAWSNDIPVYVWGRCVKGNFLRYHVKSFHDSYAEAIMAIISDLREE